MADPARPGTCATRTSLARARRHEDGTWVVSARLEPAGSGAFVVRIVAVPPEGRELRVRVETVKAEDVAVRGLVMLRDLLAPTTRRPPPSSDERDASAARASRT